MAYASIIDSFVASGAGVVSGRDKRRADHYDGQVHPHNHFICQKCHCVMDLDMENIDFIKDTASKNFGGRIDSYVTNFYGICKKCLENSWESLDKKKKLW